MVLGKASFVTLVASAMLSATVRAHGSMSAPKVEFTFNGDNTQFMATIDSSKSGFSGNFGLSPTDNTAAFNKGLSSSKYSSLKEFMNDKMVLVNTDFTKQCGYTNPKETAQPLPKTYVEWSHGSGEGFTSTHEGPCEVWCDDTRVFQDDNCAKDYPTAPAKLPYDRDACLGSSRLTIYWIALHSPTWQVYINCAALEKTTSTGAKSKYAVGGSSGGGTTSSGSTTPATDDSSSSAETTPSAEQTTDAPATEAPSTEQQSTEAPSTPAADTPTVTEAPATEAPATESPVVTPAPDTSGDTSKCSVRRYRRRN